MRHYKVLAVVLALVLLCGCGSAARDSVSPATSAPPAFSPSPSSSPPASVESAASPDVIVSETATIDDGELMRIVSTGVVLVTNSSRALVLGQETELNSLPYTNGGVTFVPVTPLLAPLGASVAKSGETWHISAKGNLTIAMCAYSIALFNTDPLFMDAPPVERDGVLFVQASALKTALSTTFSHCPRYGVIVYGCRRVLEDDELARLGELLGAQRKDARCIALDDAAKRLGLDPQTLYMAARQNRLYMSDEKGALFSARLDDDCALVSSPLTLLAPYPADSLFIADKDGLYMVFGDETEYISPLPEKVQNTELRQAAERFAMLKASYALLGDENGTKAALMAECERVSAGMGAGDEYTAINDSANYAPLPQYVSIEDEWATLFSAVRVGDFLVCAAFASDAKYGYFTHSALIIGKDAERLYVLHARSAEYGVGSGGDLDVLDAASLSENIYWRGEDVIFLCTVPTLTDAEGERMAEQAVKKFSDYRFGYGGFQGLKETNCAELVRDSYRLVGIDLGGAVGESRLNEVLKGDAKSLVILPDDLIKSDLTTVKAVWQRAK